MTRRCKICKEKYEPIRPLQVACGFLCAMVLVTRQREKKAAADAKVRAKQQRESDKERRDALRKPQYFLKRAEHAVNAWCRWRDRFEPCISCGTNDAEEWHAGHLIPVGASSFSRFDPLNINKQCRQCNYFGAGRATDYEVRLRAKIGNEAVERLKNAPRLRIWTREELQAIEKDFKQRLKDGMKNDTVA